MTLNCLFCADVPLRNYSLTKYVCRRLLFNDFYAELLVDCNVHLFNFEPSEASVFTFSIQPLAATQPNKRVSLILSFG